MTKPYVISAELELDSTAGEIVRANNIEMFREALDADLVGMGKNTEWVRAAELRDGLGQLLAATVLPVVSLDSRYVGTADYYLGISRGVDTELNDAGYCARAGFPSVEAQLENVSLLGKEVVVADDVLFSGEMIAWLAGSLERRGVRLGGVVCGIAVQEGIEKLDLMDIPVNAFRAYDDVEDEICERDFAFVPGSGRRVAAIDANALYFDDTFGRPEVWASIPSGSVREFCLRSLQRSINLLEPAVPSQAVGRFVGYGTEGTAIAQLRARMEMMQ